MDNIICIAKIRNSNYRPIQFDAVQTEWGIKFEQKTIYYDVIGTDEDLPHRKIINALRLATTVWDVEIELELKPAVLHKADITLDFRDPKTDDFMKDRANILAYAYYPGTSKQGVIVFNRDRIWSLNGDSVLAHLVDPKNYGPESKVRLRTYNILHVLIHELGHSLGLTHADDCRDCVMHPYYNGQLSLQPLDIQRITAKYPKRKWLPHRYRRFKNWLNVRIRRY